MILMVRKQIVNRKLSGLRQKESKYNGEENNLLSLNIIHDMKC